MSMISDGDHCPSPLPSPIFARCSPARGTVARRCRDFYLRRLERTADMQKRWSICDPQLDDVHSCDSDASSEGGKMTPEKLPDPTRPDKTPDHPDKTSDRNTACTTFQCTNFAADRNTVPPSEPAKPTAVDADTCAFEGYPLRKCRSSFDLAMDSLRKEISSLIAQDNALFRQLLSLHDSIAELRERQRHSAASPSDDEEEDGRASPGLDSLSGPETSPESTLSSRSSLGSSRPRKREPRPLVFVDKSDVCFRCKKMAPPYRRASSIGSLYYLHEDMESYDSGIHLQGAHSDSDHEIFV